MCGICGLIDYNPNSAIDESLLRKMCRKLEHRGPDDEGMAIFKKDNLSIGLGHRRLKIIDLSESARQPIFNEDKTVCIIFNGEIYNFQELRSILEDKGHIFKSHSDTEVIVHLYEEEGIDCVKKLRGMFAFAIWDSKAKLLLLARDRIGKKPLLYSFKNGVFCFASEFTALIASGYISKDINLSAIPDYMTFGYIPAPESIYRDIQKLLPGHILTLKDNEIILRRYWHLDYTQKINISFQDAVNSVGNLLKEAVKVRLYSDVPLGVFLSGGIDSSTITGLMAELSGEKIKTFSIGFEERDFDELKYARIIAKRFNTDHHEFIVKPNAMEALPTLIERYGEPYADYSSIPTYFVAKITRQHVTVALNGDGGDELFAGYERYKALYLSRWYTRFPRILRKGFIEPLVNMVPHANRRKNKIFLIKRFLKGADLDLPRRYLRWISFCDTEFQAKLYSQEFKNRLPNTSPERIFLPFFDTLKAQELIDLLLCIDTNTYLPNDLLVKMDIATMANSLEARSPFLDHRLIEFVVSLKADFKMRWLIKKYLLKNVIKGFIPRQNMYRSKMGFGAPVGKWFRLELKELLFDSLLSPRALSRGYFNASFIKEAVSNHVEQKADYSSQLWTLMMLELWHRRFID